LNLRRRLGSIMSMTTPTRFNSVTFDFTPLRRMRRRLGLNQRQLAHAVGVHRTTIQRLESNEQEPSKRLMVSIARALGVEENTLYDLVGGRED
jgi:DNA-binding XRE family transcriptional regulator